MFKRIVSLAVVILMLSTLFCNVAYAAVFKGSTKITPRIKTANYEVYLSLNLPKPGTGTPYRAYLAVYNKKGRMIDVQYQTAETRTFFYIDPEEYPVTIKAFIWYNTKPGIPYSEVYTFNLKSENQVIVDHLGDFIGYIKESTSEGNFMYDFNVILDEVDEKIIADAKNEELVINRVYLNLNYPDTYKKIKELANSVLNDTEKKSEAISALSTINNNYPDYSHLLIVLFKMLDLYQYIY